MISFADINDGFTLDLEQNFSELLSRCISSKTGPTASSGLQQQILNALKKKHIPLIKFNELLTGMPEIHPGANEPLREKWEGTDGLKATEQLVLKHLLAANFSLLTIMFNQYAANGLYKIAWAYLAEDARKIYGVIFIERKRERHNTEEHVLYEFRSFIYDKSGDCITHHCHHIDNFKIDQTLRVNLIFAGFGNTGVTIEKCITNPGHLLTFQITNTYNSIINPLYKYFQNLPPNSGAKPAGPGAAPGAPLPPP